MTAIKDFLCFYLHSFVPSLASTSVFKKILRTMSLLIFNWFVLIFFSVLMSTLLTKAGIMKEPVLIKKAFPTLIIALLLAGLVGPVIEEIISRLWLVYSDKKMSIAIGTLMLIVVYKMCYYIGIGNGYVSLKVGAISLFCGVLTGFVSFSVLTKLNVNLAEIFTKNIRSLAMISGVVFGYLHLVNYKFSLNLLLFSPIVLAGYLSGGLILSFIRVRYGILYAIAFHIIHNVILLLIKFR